MRGGDSDVERNFNILMGDYVTKCVADIIHNNSVLLEVLLLQPYLVRYLIVANVKKLLIKYCSLIDIIM